MKKLVISISCFLLTFIFTFFAPEDMPTNDFEHNRSLFFILGIICSFIIGCLYLLKYTVWFLQNIIPGLGKKQAITHSMAIFSFFLGLFLFFKFHQGNYSTLKWYQHYYLVFPLSSYLMALLVIIMNPISSYKEITSSEESDE